MFEKRAQFIAKNMADKVLQAVVQDRSVSTAVRKMANDLYYPKIDVDVEQIQLEKVGLALTVLDKLKGADPTPNFQYLQWLALRYSKKDFIFEDLHRVKSELEEFEKYKPRLRKDGKELDINRYKTTAEVFQLIEQYRQSGVTHSQKEDARQEEDQFIIDKKAQWFYRGDRVKIVVPLTKEASVHFGKGTRWCTSASTSSNFFDMYHKQGPLYVIMTPTGKFQFHFPTSQFMNALDQRHSVSKLVTTYPELKEAFDEVAQALGFIPLMKIVSSEGLYNALNTIMRRGSSSYGENDSVTVGELLESVDKSVQNMKIASLVIQYNPTLALKIIRPDIQATTEFHHAMIERRPELLQSADPKMQTDELVTAVIRRAPTMLRYVRADLLKKALILEAVQITPQVLGQVPKELQDMDVIKAAFKATGNMNTKRVLINMVHNKKLRENLHKTLREATE